MKNYKQEEGKDYNHYGKNKRDPQKTALVQVILNQYQTERVEDMQYALKDIFGPMFEAFLQVEMVNHLGNENNTREEKHTSNRRKGYSN